MDKYLVEDKQVYQEGPFQGRRMVHPYRTVLSRLAVMGITFQPKLVCESDQEYVNRLNRIYAGLFSDIVTEFRLQED